MPQITCQPTSAILGKIIVLILLFILTVLGCHAFFNTNLNPYTDPESGHWFYHYNGWDGKYLGQDGKSLGHDFEQQCILSNEKRALEQKTENWDEFYEEDPKCPDYAHFLEVLFVLIVILVLTLSFLNLGLNFMKDLTAYRKMDMIFHLVSGVFVLLAGLLITASALSLDHYVIPDKSKWTEKEKKDSEAITLACRRGYKFGNKLAAGMLGLVTGILHFVTAYLIFKAPKRQINWGTVTELFSHVTQQGNKNYRYERGQGHDESKSEHQMHPLSGQSSYSSPTWDMDQEQ